MKIHTVQKGDTLWKIAKQYNVDFKELLRINTQIKNPDRIMPGMKVKIPSVHIPLRPYGNPGHNRPTNPKKEVPITPPQPEAEQEELPQLEAEQEELPRRLEELEQPPVQEAPIPQMPIQQQPIQPTPQPPMQQQMPTQPTPQPQQILPQIPIMPPMQPQMPAQPPMQRPAQPPMQPQMPMQRPAQPPMQPQMPIQPPMQMQPQMQMQPPRQQSMKPLLPMLQQILPRMTMPMPMMPCQPGPMPFMAPFCPPTPHPPMHQRQQMMPHTQLMHPPQMHSYDCSSSADYSSPSHHQPQHHMAYPSTTYPSQAFPSSSYQGSTYHSPIFPLTTEQSSSAYDSFPRESSAREVRESSGHQSHDYSSGESVGDCQSGCSPSRMEQPSRQYSEMRQSSTYSMLNQPYHHGSSSSTHMHATPYMHSPMFHLHQPMPLMPGHEVSPCWDDGLDESSSGD